MGNETTKPNGRSMDVKDEDAEVVQKRIESAGYEFRVDAVEAVFEPVKNQSKDGSGSNSSSSSAKRKAGDHTIVGASKNLHFMPYIEHIVAGPKLKLKGKVKEVKKTTKSKNHAEKEDTNKDEK